MLAVLMSVVDRSKNPSKIELSQSEVHRAAIIADFCKSIAAFELCLSSGLYGAVATLARREIEAVNNCFAHRRDEQRNKKNPRIKPFRHLNDIYAELSGIAHNTDRDGMLLLSGGSPANLDPEFDLLRTEQLLMVHIHCVCGIALEASDIVSAEADKSGLDEREKHYCSVALGVLVKRGFLRGYDLDASL